MIDVVEYALPFGPLGRLGHPLIRRQLRKIFTHRNESIGEHLPIPPGKSIVRWPVVFS